MGRTALLLEFLALFAGGPLLVAASRSKVLLAGLLWCSALLAWRVVRRTQAAPFPKADLRRELRALLVRLALLGPLLTLAAWLAWPEHFLALPRTRPWLWLAVLAAYPLFSVWPQEVLFRSFLLQRYRPLFGDCAGFVAASALAFGFAHVLYLNPVAVGLSALGGLLFASAYARHRSLALACLEHALYGCLVFTVGLGRFFYTGATWGQ